MRILVCEDQDAIRKMIETLIGASGHSVVAVDTARKPSNGRSTRSSTSCSSI